MTTPRFVRFCRALALMGGPCVGFGAISIPTFVEGCSSDVMRCQGPCGTNSGIQPYDTGPTPEAAVDAEPEAEAGADVLDASEAGDGGPGELPDLPFFRA